MTTFAIILFCVLVSLAAGQAILVAQFAWKMLRWRPATADDANCPKAAVILCLRGLDPFLHRCVTALLRQDYPRFDVCIVVDNRADPAWSVAHELVKSAGANNVRIIPLTHRKETCSLKCSSLLEAISGLDSSYGVVALLDADTIPHPTWLRELAAALADPTVGAATGNRWYIPHETTWATAVRSLWNAAAIVQMYCYHIPWGGTLAIKTSVFRQSNVLDRWAHALCEDTMLFGALRKLGLKVAFVPSLMMVNRESCDMPGFFHWVRRQLLVARLYHPGWPLVLGHGVLTCGALLAGFAALAGAAIAGHGIAATWLAAGLAVYLAAMPLMLGAIERSVVVNLVARGEPVERTLKKGPFGTIFAALVTQAVYTAALLGAAVQTRVQWRGISYRLGRGGQVRMLGYQPYSSSAAPNASSSL